MITRRPRWRRSAFATSSVVVPMFKNSEAWSGMWRATSPAMRRFSSKHRTCRVGVGDVLDRGGAGRPRRGSGAGPPLRASALMSRRIGLRRHREPLRQGVDADEALPADELDDVGATRSLATEVGTFGVRAVRCEHAAAGACCKAKTCRLGPAPHPRAPRARQPASSRSRSVGRQARLEAPLEAPGPGDVPRARGRGPTARPARQAAPSAVVSVTAGRSTGRSRMSARNWQSQSLATMPPSTRSAPGRAPPPARSAVHRRHQVARSGSRPPRAPRARSAAMPLSRVRPRIAPRASGSQCGAPRPAKAGTR